MAAPENLLYTEEHDWVLIDGDTATVGITDRAQQDLGDIVFVELPAPGTRIDASGACGEIESTKSVCELHAAVGGEVLETNQAVVDSPELVNSDPYGAGWLLKVRVSDLPELLSPAAYDELTAK